MANTGLGAAERDELVRLRRENRQLRVERDILSRAAEGTHCRRGTVETISDRRLARFDTLRPRLIAIAAHSFEIPAMPTATNERS